MVSQVSVIPKRSMPLLTTRSDKAGMNPPKKETAAGQHKSSKFRSWLFVGSFLSNHILFKQDYTRHYGDKDDLPIQASVGPGRGWVTKW